MNDEKGETAFLLAHSNPHHPNDLTRWEPLTGGNGHIHRVARRALKFARSAFGYLPELRILGLVAGRWHDLGKFSQAFQQYLRSAAGDSHQGETTGRVDHSSAGAQHAMVSLPPPLNAMVAYAIAGHHSGLLDSFNSQRACLKARLRKNDLPRWRDRVPEKFLNAPQVARPTLKPTTKSDAAFQLGFATRMLFPCLAHADFLATESFMNPEQAAERPQGTTDFTALDRHLTRFLDDRFRRTEGRVAEARAGVLAACRDKAKGKPGFYSLTVPTGGGKTLWSLGFALPSPPHAGALHLVRGELGPTRAVPALAPAGPRCARSDSLLANRSNPRQPEYFPYVARASSPYRVY